LRGNPALRSRYPAVLGRIVTAREQTRLAALLPGADAWVAVVRRLRPVRSWEEAQRCYYENTSSIVA
jgi:hypothetical protein